MCHIRSTAILSQNHLLYTNVLHELLYNNQAARLQVAEPDEEALDAAFGGALGHSRDCDSRPTTVSSSLPLTVECAGYLRSDFRTLRDQIRIA